MMHGWWEMLWWMESRGNVDAASLRLMILIDSHSLEICDKYHEWLVVSNMFHFPFHKKGCHPSHWRTHIVQRAGEKPPRWTARYERCALSKFRWCLMDPRTSFDFLKGNSLQANKKIGNPWTPQYFMVINWGKTMNIRLRCSQQKQCVEVSSKPMSCSDCVPQNEERQDLLCRWWFWEYIDIQQVNRLKFVGNQIILFKISKYMILISNNSLKFVWYLESSITPFVFFQH